MTPILQRIPVRHYHIRPTRPIPAGDQRILDDQEPLAAPGRQHVAHRRLRRGEAAEKRNSMTRILITTALAVVAAALLLLAAPARSDGPPPKIGRAHV